MFFLEVFIGIFTPHIAHSSNSEILFLVLISELKYTDNKFLADLAF